MNISKYKKILVKIKRLENRWSNDKQTTNLDLKLKKEKKSKRKGWIRQCCNIVKWLVISGEIPIEPVNS